MTQHITLYSQEELSQEELNGIPLIEPKSLRLMINQLLNLLIHQLVQINILL